MADITMCPGTECPVKETCYRFTAQKNPYWQSMFMVVPCNKEENTCEYYWKVENETC